MSFVFVPRSFVRCESRIDNFASKVALPEQWCNIDTHHPNIPQLFVINVQVGQSREACSQFVN